MLNVTESVNGKFNILLSDGYKSQLHDRGKVKANSELVTDDVVGKRVAKVKAKQSVTQRKPKHNKEPPNYGKATKPSRIAAKFSGKLPDNNGGEAKTNNKRQSTAQKSNDVTGSSPANETTAFVTKNDLAKLLEALNVNNKENVSAVKNEPQARPIDPGEKNSQPIESSSKDAEEVNINANYKLSENLPHHEQKDDASVVKQNNPEETVATAAMIETIKPAAMRSSFAIGAPGLVISNPHDDKAVKHRQWVKELEKQIQEKKEREELMKRNQSIDITPQFSAKRIESEKSASRQKNETDPARIAFYDITPLQQENDRLNTGHARGRGLMSMITENEGDKQRKKIIEHQKAIERQVEDRKRQKMEQRERRLREEAIENDRVAKEREKLQKQFEDEMKKMKEKEEQAKRRALLMQEGIAKACESAQQLKHEKRKNRMQEPTAEVIVKVSRDDDVDKTHQQQISSENCKRKQQDDRNVVPPLNLSRSISPGNKLKKSNEKFSSRQSDSKARLNSLSVRETSYSEADKDRSEALMNKWVNEDFGSESVTAEQNYDRHSEAHLSSEVIIPFHRTASATLFSETTASHDVHESTDVLETTVNSSETRPRKVVKKGRSVPEVQPTRASRLREKETNNKNSSLTSRRKKHGTEAPEQIVQKQRTKQQISPQDPNDDRTQNTDKNESSVNEESKMTNIPSHLLATFTPTAHQEKILEQLAALRKGLLMKDQEIKTRVFQINEYEIQV